MGKLIGYLRPRSVHTADMNFIVSRSGFWVFKANIIYKSECRGLFVKIRFHQFDQLVNDNGRKYRENKTDIDDIVDKFENDIWTEYDNYAAEKTSGSDQNTEKNNNQGEE